MGMMINRRRVCGGKNLPYDYEVEYLRSNKITDAAYRPTIDIDVEITKVTGFDIYCYNENARNGGRDGNTSILGRGINIDWSITYTDWVYIKHPLGSVTTSAALDPDSAYTRFYAMVDQSGNYEFKIYINNSLYIQKSGTGDISDLASYGKLYLFNNKNNAGNKGGACNLYYAKFYNHQQLIRDFIPVVKDGVGYLYDKVSKRLFGNAGTGNFIIGPILYGHYDCEVEYLEATGTQWIDTGFKATGGCIFDFEAMWTDYDGVIVGSHNPSSNSSNGFNRNMAYINAQNKVLFNKCGNYTSFSYPCSTGIKYHVYYNTIGGNRIGSIDGNVIVNQTNTATLNPVNNVVFFLAQYDSTCKKGRIYNCKLYDSTSTLVRDFIPVRLGFIGLLYDKVSGKLFGNNGTGNFVLGPDKS